MRNARILLVSLLTVFVLITHPILSLAADGGGNGYDPSYAIEYGHNRLAMTERFADRLDLSQDQRKALDDIADKYRSDLSDLQQLMADNSRMLAKMQAGDPKLQESAEAQGKTIADLIIVHKKIRADVDKVLTDAQREKLDRIEAQARLMKAGKE